MPIVDWLWLLYVINSEKNFSISYLCPITTMQIRIHLFKNSLTWKQIVIAFIYFSKHSIKITFNGSLWGDYIAEILQSCNSTLQDTRDLLQTCFEQNIPYFSANQLPRPVAMWCSALNGCRDLATNDTKHNQYVNLQEE